MQSQYFSAIARGDAENTGNTKQRFISLYEKVSGKKYDGWNIPNGLLEVGRALGPAFVDSVLAGCLPEIQICQNDGHQSRKNFDKVIMQMEKEDLAEVTPPKVEDIVKRNTLLLAVSYKHTIIGGEKSFPRRRMNDRQKNDLFDALVEIAGEEKCTGVVLWFDQAMGQRFPIDERDWVKHGILPYFCFDVIYLNEQIDFDRCWLFLEKVMGTKHAEEREVSTKKAVRFCKNYKMGTVTPMEEVASSIFNGILKDKDAYRTEDKDQIGNWALSVLDYVSWMADLSLRFSGSIWQSDSRYTVKKLSGLIMMHTIDDDLVSWKNLSPENKGKKWNGMSELLGKPDHEVMTTCDKEEIWGHLKNKEGGYLFIVLRASSRSRDENVQAVAIGSYARASRPPRVIVCLLNSECNSDQTKVSSSCILDFDRLSKDQEFSLFEDALGVVRKVYEYNQWPQWDQARYKKIVAGSDKNPPWHRQCRLPTSNMEKDEFLDWLLCWPLLTKKLREKGIKITTGLPTLDILQAGDVKWS